MVVWEQRQGYMRERAWEYVGLEGCSCMYKEIDWFSEAVPC